MAMRYYEGKLGFFDYDDSQFQLDQYEIETIPTTGEQLPDGSYAVDYNQPIGKRLEPYLHYIGSETDGRNINIPDGLLTTVYMFKENNNLTYGARIPSSVRSVDAMYEDCKNLRVVPDFPDGVETYDATFYGCESLEKAPKLSKNGMVFLGTFIDCKSLREPPEFPENTKLVDHVFDRCSDWVQSAGRWNANHPGQNFPEPTPFNHGMLFGLRTIAEQYLGPDFPFDECMDYLRGFMQQRNPGGAPPYSNVLSYDKSAQAVTQSYTKAEMESTIHDAYKGSATPDWAPVDLPVDGVETRMFDNIKYEGRDTPTIKKGQYIFPDNPNEKLFAIDVPKSVSESGLAIISADPQDLHMVNDAKGNPHHMILTDVPFGKDVKLYVEKDGCRQVIMKGDELMMANQKAMGLTKDWMKEKADPIKDNHGTYHRDVVKEFQTNVNVHHEPTREYHPISKELNTSKYSATFKGKDGKTYTTVPPRSEVLKAEWDEYKAQKGKELGGKSLGGQSSGISDKIDFEAGASKEPRYQNVVKSDGIVVNNTQYEHVGGAKGVSGYQGPVQVKDDEKKSKLYHYHDNGKVTGLGRDLDYDPTEWEIKSVPVYNIDKWTNGVGFEETQEKRLIYIGKETDGSKIKIPEGLHDEAYKDMFKGRSDIKSAPAIPKTHEDFRGVSSIDGLDIDKMFDGCSPDVRNEAKWNLKNRGKCATADENIGDYLKWCDDQKKIGAAMDKGERVIQNQQMQNTGSGYQFGI